MQYTDGHSRESRDLVYVSIVYKHDLLSTICIILAKSITIAPYGNVLWSGFVPGRRYSGAPFLETRIIIHRFVGYQSQYLGTCQLPIGLV